MVNGLIYVLCLSNLFRDAHSFLQFDAAKTNRICAYFCFLAIGNGIISSNESWNQCNARNGVLIQPNLARIYLVFMECRQQAAGKTRYDEWRKECIRWKFSSTFVTNQKSELSDKRLQPEPRAKWFLYL